MATRRFEITDAGRALTFDDVGDPGGLPVLYLHGTPDSRLARHPDDGVAARCGVRLLAVDRPGFGGSTPSPRRTDLADDVIAVLDDLGIARVHLLGWSSGGLAGLASAGTLAGRCSAVTLVGTLPPVEAYADPEVLAALGPGRRSFVEMAAEGTPAELAAEVAPYLVPMPLDAVLAREHVLEGAGAVGAAELAAVPGALDRMAEALLAGVAQGTAGIELDLVHQLTPGLELAGLGPPVHTVHGELDPISPPAVGQWLGHRLPEMTLEVVPGAAHHLLFPHWERLLRELVARDPGA